MPSSDASLLEKRVDACIPKGIAPRKLSGEHGQTYYIGRGWQAQFMQASASDDALSCRLMFSDPVSGTDIQSQLQMNVLATAVEKALLLTSDATLVEVRYATSAERDFEIGVSPHGESATLAIAEWAEVTSPVFLVLRALKAGSSAARDLADSASISELNKLLAQQGVKASRLVDRYRATPALPDALSDAFGAQPPPAGQDGLRYAPSRFCAVCGAEAGLSERFCGNCGNALTDRGGLS